MKRIFLVLILAAGTLTVGAQGRSNLSVGIDAAIPTYAMVGEMKGLLTGIYIKKEWGWGKHFAGTLNAGYQYFKGTATTFDDKEVEDYAVVPLLVGLKGYVIKNTYLSFETGVNISAHKNSATHMAFVPSIGTLIPVGTRQIDLSIRYNATKSGMTYPEAPPFRRGGFALLGIRIGLVL